MAIHVTTFWPRNISVILIDTDILVDIAIDRQPHADAAVELSDLVQDRFEHASVAWHTISNVYYILRPISGDMAARQFIMQITSYLEVAQTGNEDVNYAIQLPMNDFEDAMQVAAARACGARAIVTRNLRDYRNSPIPAMSPQQFLNTLN